jgi:hypothetical protein
VSPVSSAIVEPPSVNSSGLDSYPTNNTSSSIIMCSTLECTREIYAERYVDT